MAHHDAAYQGGFIAGYIFFYAVLILVPVYFVRRVVRRFRGRK